MSAGGVMSAAQLLKLDDGQFEADIKEMSTKRLMETISTLQREMSREQENFNSLTSELGSLKKNSGQYKSVSKDIAMSQARLTQLMNRSMKCFTQQGNQQSKTAVDKRNLADTQQSEVQLRTSGEFSKVISDKKVNKSDTRSSSNFSVKVAPANPSRQVNPLRTSDAFTDEMNKVISSKTQNGGETGGLKSESSSLSDKDSPRSEGSRPNSSDSAKRLSNNFVNTARSVQPNLSSLSGNQSSDSKTSPREIKTNSVNGTMSDKPVSASTNGAAKSSVTLGPISSQSKYISKSTDSVLKKTELVETKKPDASYKSTKPRTVMVMNEDKQVIDLDSFTDRKNMLSELKGFSKELKPVAKPKQDQVVANSGKNNDSSSKNTVSEAKSNVLGDIKLGLKPSQFRETKDSVGQGKVIDKKLTSTSADLPEKREVVKDGSDDQIKMFDALLEDVYDADSDNNSTKDEVIIIRPNITTVNKYVPPSAGHKVPKDLPTETNSFIKTGDIKQESDDTASQSSEISEEDDRFVTEFQFTSANLKPVNAVKETTVKKKTEAPVPPSSAKTSAGTVKTNGAPAPGVTPGAGSQPQFNEDGEELVVQSRVTLMDWDPAKVYEELYSVKMMPDNIEDISHRFIGMEGLMEKLPMNKKKATLLKTWKRRFFKAADGWLHYYETSNRDKPSDSLQLMGGKIEELGPRVLGVDDGRGKYLMVRVPTDQEYGQWKVALESQTADNVKATYIRPAPASIPHPKKKVIIVDIGSSGIRAGILGERPTLPQLFFPSVVAVNKQTGEIIVGPNAMRPDVRRVSNIIHPIEPTNKVDKFNIDMEVMTAVLKKVFDDLSVNPKDFLVMLSTPQNLGDKLKGGLMKILVDHFHVKGACMVQQTLLAMYSYNAMSGILVDIGERFEIMPVYEGVLIEGGVSRQAYGGMKVQDSLYITLLENKYKFNTPVEKLLVRYISEQACYVTQNYKEAKQDCDKDPASFTKTVNLKDFNLPDGAYQTVNLDYGCFKSPEGFFNTDMWEMDYKNIQRQIFEAIQQCPMDSRKHMYRSVYLSGGVTMVPGFSDRLEQELKKLAPPSVVVEVHASPQRYHAAYIGACSVAGMDIFEMSCVMADEWKKLGVKACRKWGTS